MKENIYMVNLGIVEEVLQSIEHLHKIIRRSVRKNILDNAVNIKDITGSGNGDVSYGLDTACEEIIDSFFAGHTPEGGCVVICEGLGRRVYPHHLIEKDARWLILIDPIDGTRHIMYDNRSAWILTGIAENQGKTTNLLHICAAIQTEIPIILQDKGVVLKAIRGYGAEIKTYDLAKEIEIQSHISLQPSSASTLENGFCIFTNFFPGTKEIISAVEENVIQQLYGIPKENSGLVFSEQYISSAGQLYMLMTGKYRMVADIRPLLKEYLSRQKKALPLCAHPYDLSTTLIAEECGCIIRDIYGEALGYPLDLDTNCFWIGYSNLILYNEIQPIIQETLKMFSLL